MPTNKDYWPHIIRLAGNQGKIQAPGQRTLDQYLAGPLNLSRPTVRALLSILEGERLIRLQKDGLTRKLVGLEVVSSKSSNEGASLSPELLKVGGTMFGREKSKPQATIAQRPKRVQIIVLFDWENFIITIRGEGPPDQFSIEDKINKLTREITEEIGEIVGKFVFIPPDRALVWSKILYNLGFKIYVCPRIKSKGGEEQDTTDQELIEMGEWLMEHLDPDRFTHIAVWSGDKDFKPLLQKAFERGKKRIIAAATPRSLSFDLAQLADINANTGRPMGYFFSQTQ